VLPSGTIPFMAPEFLRDKDIKYLESTEVYSFGVCMWEIFNEGQDPYPGL
jgi:serine/threonine protein kinase